MPGSTPEPLEPPPVRAATIDFMDVLFKQGVSIRAAREGGDTCDGLEQRTAEVSIRAAREGGDPAARPTTKRFGSFNPRRP